MAKKLFIPSDETEFIYLVYIPYDDTLKGPNIELCHSMEAAAEEVKRLLDSPDKKHGDQVTVERRRFKDGMATLKSLSEPRSLETEAVKKKLEKSLIAEELINRPTATNEEVK
jgi:hypothetical protein